MEKFNTFKKGVFSLVVLGLLFTSCSESEDISESANQVEDTFEVKRSAEIDQVDNILGDLVIDAYEGQEVSEDGRGTYTGDIPECVTITVVAQQGYRQVTLDFGTDGCVVNGHILNLKSLLRQPKGTFLWFFAYFQPISGIDILKGRD